MFVSRFCTAITGVMLLAPFFAYSGNLDSPAAPTDTGSAMYTLSDIYHRLDTGSPPPKEPALFRTHRGPTAGTGRTLGEVMAKAPSMDNTNGASASHVLFGKTFWGLTSALGDTDGEPGDADIIRYQHNRNRGLLCRNDPECGGCRPCCGQH